MRSRTLIILLIASVTVSCAGTKRRASITHDELVKITSRLASDEFRGRGTGTGFDSLAALYIRKEFSRDGLRPFIDDGFEKFRVTVSAESGQANFLSVGGDTLVPGTDYIPLSLTANSTLDAEVVYCGYGFMADNDSVKWNDFSGTDIKGKWVLLLRGYPEKNPSASRFSAYSSDRMKVLSAKDNGAAGVLLVSGEDWDVTDNLDKPSREESSSGIPVFQVKRGVADMILAGAGKTIVTLEKECAAMAQPVSVVTTTVVKGTAEVLAREASTSNVIMFLEGTTLKDQYIVVGAHYDHLGMGGPGSSSRSPDTVAVHYGADDNASGVALMIELAGRLASDRHGHARNIIFVAFSGEEMGLLGSKYFVENMGIDPASIDLMVNLDMVGRLNKEKNLQVGGVGTATGLRDSVMKYNDTTLLSLTFTEEGYGPSDHSSFYGKDIPVLIFTTGAHLDYHTPDDTFDKLNYAGMVRIGNLLYSLVDNAANDSLRYSFTVAGPKGPSVSMSRRRGVTLGIMPDFAGNVKNGLRADFVTPGKPAALGGMIKGDVIVAIEDKPVSNIEDYMFRLSQLKPGQRITVEVVRDGKHELLLIQL